MFPDRKTALQELAKAEELNPGPWGEHSRNVAHAAELIAGRCDKMDSDKAFVCGLLHDIGRRTGVAAVRHIIDGYDYAAARGWDEVARICLTHSFPVKDIEADIGKKDISAAQYAFIRDFLNGLDYDDYDKMITLAPFLQNVSAMHLPTPVVFASWKKDSSTQQGAMEYTRFPSTGGIKRISIRNILKRSLGIPSIPCSRI